jgi:exosome complex protein LRP1
MTNESKRLRAKLASLNLSLDELEAQLEPLFSQSLPETVVGLDKIQQAKLQVAVPYLVQGLSFGTLDQSAGVTLASLSS